MKALGAFALALAAGCGDSAGSADGGSQAGFERSGTLINGTAPSGARVAVMWLGTSGGDYAIKFGEATPVGTQFTLGLDADPPIETIGSNGVGIGIVVLVAHDVPDGTKLSTDADFAALGISGWNTDAPIVWRTAGATPDPTWTGTFPPGYACGRCARGTGANGLDGVAVGDCPDEDIDLAATKNDACNLD